MGFKFIRRPNPPPPQPLTREGGGIKPLPEAGRGLERGLFLGRRCLLKRVQYLAVFIHNDKERLRCQDLRNWHSIKVRSWALAHIFGGHHPQLQTKEM